MVRGGDRPGLRVSAVAVGGKLLLGTIGALIGAFLGAVAWAAITASTTFQIGYMAVGVGFLAGLGMRILGGGRSRTEGFVAGGVALLGCVFGNLLATVFVIAQQYHKPILLVLGTALSHPAFAGVLLREGFNVMDPLFYGLAMYAGYRAALKPPAADAVSSEPVS